MDWLPRTLMFVLCMLLLATYVESGASLAVPSCGSPEKDEELEACIQIGSRFLHRFLRNIEKGRAGKDPCDLFKGFRACLKPLLDECPDLRDELKTHWIKAYELFEGSCDGNAEYLRRIDCIDTNYRSVLMKRCDAFYKFNKRQRTQKPCHFLRESLRCKEALITSACVEYEDAGDYALHIFKLHSYDELKKHDCHVSRETPYEGFRYTESCPASYAEELDKCDEEEQYMKLPFLKDNDLIAEADRQTLRRACSDFHNYKRCIQPIRQQCPRGTEMFFEILFKLRTYNLKMDYICGDALKQYKNNFKCYQEVHTNGSLRTCDHIWSRVSELLPEVSAHEFYCRMDLEKTITLQRLLVEVVACYQGAFTVCDDQGEVIAGLMNRTFQDPRYLRYKYKPDCELHAQVPPSDPPHSTAIAPTTRGQDKVDREQIATDLEQNATELNPFREPPASHTDRQIEILPETVPDHHTRPGEETFVDTVDAHDRDEDMPSVSDSVTTRPRRHKHGPTSPPTRTKKRNSPGPAEITSASTSGRLDFYILMFTSMYAVLHTLQKRDLLT